MVRRFRLNLKHHPSIHPSTTLPPDRPTDRPPLARSTAATDRPTTLWTFRTHRASSNVRPTARCASSEFLVADRSVNVDQSRPKKQSVPPATRGTKSRDVASPTSASLADRPTAMGARTRATRRRAGGSASTSASTSDDGGDDPRAIDTGVDDDDAGCKTPERVAPSADDVRLDNRNFPARFSRGAR